MKRNTNRKALSLLLAGLLALALPLTGALAADGEPAAQESPVPTATPVPTETPAPTGTPAPTETPAPQETPENTAPALADGVEAAAEAELALGETFELDLTGIFTDPDADDALTYFVSVDGAEAVAAEAEYLYTPEAEGETSLVFTADDGAAVSPTYTVTLTTGPAAEPPAMALLAAGAPADPDWSGSGAADDPWLLEDADDLTRLSARCAGGESFSGRYFRMTADIALPDGWTPVGTSAARFSASIDGGGRTLTVPEGGRALIGCPEGATLSHLNIFGSRIAGCGVVDLYVQGSTITIEDVTLKAGTQTLLSGFVGGFGSDSVVIRGCAVEAGVVIGYDGTRSNIGSFGGDFNGVVENCVSSAEVRGVSFVGGICGSKGQAMREYIIRNCEFHGSVAASGNYAGGISGSGYAGTGWGIETAPNTACANIYNCLVTGSVSGQDGVGGILGAEAGVVQCWANGTGHIQDNLFVGTLSGSSHVGGIVGLMNSLNRYTILENNYYTGSYEGIGGAAYVDTSAAHETASGAAYIDTSTSTAACPPVAGCSWRTQHNRADDPLGADADDLAAAASEETLRDGTVLACLNRLANALRNWIQGVSFPVHDTGAPVLSRLTVTGTYRTEYDKGEALNLTGAIFTAFYSDGSSAALDLSALTVSGYDPQTVGKQTVTVAYGTRQAELTVTVRADPAGDAAALIDAIGTVTKARSAAIRAARTAYNALSAEDRARVSNYAVLTAAERRLAALTAGGSTSSLGNGASADGKTVVRLNGVTYTVDKAAAELIRTISALAALPQPPEADVLAAWRQYAAMSDGLKAQIFNYDELAALVAAGKDAAPEEKTAGTAATAALPAETDAPAAQGTESAAAPLWLWLLPGCAGAGLLLLALLLRKKYGDDDGRGRQRPAE